jgi:hypothetical protein
MQEIASIAKVAAMVVNTVITARWSKMAKKTLRTGLYSFGLHPPGHRREYATSTGQASG